MLKIRFGPAGKPLNFKGDIVKVPEYLKNIDLEALEYEAVRGVKISEEKARRLGEEAKKYDIVLSMHAPYFINLAGSEDVINRSLQRLRQALIAAEWMGAYAIVFHPGYYKGNKSKEEAVRKVIEALKNLMEEVSDTITRPQIAPETTGKTSQVGDVDEVIEICRNVPRCRPCVDWAHLHARYQGNFIRSVDDVLRVIEKIERELGSSAVNPLHTHFSKIEFGKGGEKEHHTLGEKEYGPEWEHVCKAYLETGISAVVISESPILDRDAILMKKVCQSLVEKIKP